MRKLHRAVALLLTLMMVLSVLPLGAAAYVGPDVAVPEGQELVYFADCGATSFTSDIEALIAQYPDSVVNKTTPDQAYDASSTTPWGYTNPTGEIETNYPDSGDIYKSVRNFQSGQNGKTLSYKFTVPAGTYQVAVGLYDPWSSSNPLTRVAEVQVNQSASQEFRYSGSNADMLTFKNIALAEAGTIDVNVAPDDPNANEDNRDALVSFIMVTRTVEEPDPEPTVPEAPNPQTPIWGPNGRNFALHVHYICDNEDAAHQGGNDVLDKKNFITAGEYFTFGAVTEHNGVYEVTATVNANKLLEDKFGVAHTVAGTTTLTLEYLEASKKWAIKSDSDVYELTLTGTCTVGGPEAPTNETCSTFYVTVYGIDGADTNRVLRSTAHTVSNGGFTISYGQVQKIDGVWTCEATIDATDKINSVLESQQANHYIMEDGAPTSKTVTLTYNQNSGKWVAENDGVTYSDSKVRAGVAFPLIKQYSVTYLPGDQLNGNPVPGDPIDGGLFAVDATVPLPQTTTFTNDGYIFAGWKTTVQEGSKKVTHYFPVGTTTMDMFAQDVELKAYWMKLTLEVANVPYRENLAVDDYTFGDTASFSPDEDSVTLLYRADIWGNSTYPYALTCEGAQEVYGSSLSGTIPLSSTTTYVYFTKTYTPEDEISSETVSMAGASDSAAVSITWNTQPDMPNQENAFFHVTVYSEEAQLDGSAAKNKEINSVWWGGYPDLVDVKFTKPVQGSGGIWTCQATINAEAYVAKTIEDSTNTPYRRSDDPTTKTITLTYNEATEKWIVPSDGVDYATGGSKNGVAFKLVKQFKVTFAPGRDLSFGIPSGEEYSGGAHDAGALVELPETANFVPSEGEFAGWCTTIKYSYLDSRRFFYPIGTDMEGMFATDVTLEAYWMDVELEVASEVYDETKTVKEYTFSDTATFQDVEDSVTVLYRASVWGNTGYPYELTCQDATSVYDTTLSGTMPFVGGTPRTYVYFTKTYTPSDGTISSETVTMGNASDNAAVSITWKEEHEHTYGEPEWDWAADYSTATATFTCSSCDDVHTETATATSSTTAPTCTEAGETVYSATVTFNGTEYTGTKTVTLPATGHDYGDPQWTWNTDNNTATATFTCSSCDDVHTETATATSSTTAPTCTEAGETVYSATVTFNGTEYTGTKTVTLPATGHDYGDPQWTWNTDNNTATAKFTCSACDDVQTVTATVTSTTTEPTCTTDGQTIYTATVTFSGEDHTDTKTVTIPATGHKYGAPVWAWAADNSTATAKFTCSACGDVQNANATVTSTTTEPTCTTDGQTVYTATVTFGGEDHTNAKTVTITANGHKYGAPVWAWAADYSSATAKFTCSVCDDVQTVNATVTPTTTEPTCTTDGQTVYTATVTFDGKSYSSEKTVTLPATGHKYGAPQWTWAADNTASAKFTCSACDDVQTVTATVTSTTTEPTCTADGKTVYTATVSFGGEDHTNTKTVTITATGHDYGAPVWAWAADNSTATAKFTCSACGDVQNANATVTSTTTEPTCTADGKTVYTATVSFGGKNHTDTKTVTLPATGHDYGAPQWSWHKDYTAYAVFTCANDKTHQETCKASVTRSVQKATCTRPETTTYTATVVFNGTRYQDKLVVEGYALGHRWNDGEVTTRPTASKPGEKTYTCLRCGAVKYETIPATGETVVDYFWDVSAHDWFADEVTYVVEAGLMEGVGNHLFDPNGEVTRAMTWTVLARMDGEDVDGGTPWYAKARTWAMDDGVSDGTNPNNAVTREQLVTMLYRYTGSPRVYGTLTGYTDCDKVSDWAVDAMIWATDTGLIQGMGGKLNPQGTATRAQLATMLMRFVEIMK